MRNVPEENRDLTEIALKNIALGITIKVSFFK